MSSIISLSAGLHKKETEAPLIQFNLHGGRQMRSLKIALVALTLIGFFGTQAKAQNNNVVEGLIIGTAVGGVIGLIVASEMDRNSYGRERVYHEPVVYDPPPRHKRYYGSRSHFRYDHRGVESRRNIVVVRDHHGRYGESVKTRSGRSAYRERR
jgi:hypothetical protein